MRISPAISATALLISLPVLGTVLFPIPSAFADASASTQGQIDANNQEVTALTDQIAQYEAQLKQIGTEKKTLQDAVNSLNLQSKQVQAKITLTQHQINITELQIQQLGSSISDTQDSITTNQSTLEANMRVLQKQDEQSTLFQLIASSDLSQAWDDLNAIAQVQNAVVNQTQTLQTHKNNLTDSQNAAKQKQATLAAQKKSLAAEQQSLAQTAESKKELLAETGAQESNYQKLLSDAKQQLASFTTFAANAGGSGLLINQTSCDSWGCYYNQRDAAWGNDALNGTQYQLKSDGCLVTSMAMMMTHYGHPDVTPVSINSDPSNFAAYYSAYLLKTISVDGVTATRKATYINSTLATGNPVVVGLRAYGGTHFVVLVRKEGSDYIMRDPYIPNGKDVSFSAHYSLNEVYEVARVIVS
ncbi:MAG: hypothetical protein KGI60_02520 [Patescibacteria group bacterium]|nr:hypothetical protein [Patescibacteria group bacterium]